jgi:steroid delta-isomerase-like uncharacterized protein
MADVPAAATAQDQATDSNTTRMRERREAIVREHVDAENRRDIDAVIATFDRPRYEVNGEVSDGEGSVRGLLEEMLTAFPDFNAEDGKIHYSDDAVIGEGRVTGTHDGPFAGIPPTGRRIAYPLVAIFEFAEDRLVCEKVYFDSATMLAQIGALSDPNGE